MSKQAIPELISPTMGYANRTSAWAAHAKLGALVDEVAINYFDR